MIPTASELAQARKRAASALVALESHELDHGISPIGKPLPLVHEHNRLLQELCDAKIAVVDMEHRISRAVQISSE